MGYAVIATGGKQYKVFEGSVVQVDRLGTQPQADVVFDRVLLYVEGDAVSVGKPYLSHVRVYGKTLAHVRGEKLRVAKYKAKARYRRVRGYRHALSAVQIEKIESASKDHPESGATSQQSRKRQGKAS